MPTIDKKISEKDTIDLVKSKSKVKIAVTDIDGILRGKYISIDKFLSIAKSNFGFCNVVFGWDCADSCYENTSYTGWHTGYPDAIAKIDLSTLREIPWENKTPLFLADFINDDGKALSVCPRQVLKKQIKKAEDLGFKPKFGLEFEWFNFQETPQSLKEKGYLNPSPISPGMFGYSILRASYNRDFFHAVFDELKDFKIPIEGLHTETGPGVYEAALLPTDPLEAADRGVLFKSAVKEISYRFNNIASFMAKWNSSLPGCSGHVHQSLMNSNSTQNVFYDEKGKNKMSKIFEHYLAGQLHCMLELLPFWVPNINSYKRLVEGLWAPTKLTWGTENRTSALRVIPAGEKSTRLETRIGGADFNPYLAIAASLSSGLYGIENKLELNSEAVSGNAYEAKDASDIPRNLLEATEKMAKSKIANELFGSEFIDHFAKTRIWEWKQFQKSVTNWELERYFEII